MTQNSTIFIVDDNEEVIKSLAWLFESVNYKVEAYHDAQSFLNHYDASKLGCLVLDVRMPELTGLELQEILNEQNIQIPIIFVTAHADTPMAVRAMKLGAIDFLTKPVNNQMLLETINKAIKLDAERRTAEEKKIKILAKLNKLTQREYEVMLLMTRGTLNKNIAYKLGISNKTVELHRANMMKKMCIRNIAELIRLILDCKPEILDEKIVASKTT